MSENKLHLVKYPELSVEALHDLKDELGEDAKQIAHDIHEGTTDLFYCTVTTPEGGTLTEGWLIAYIERYADYNELVLPVANGRGSAAIIPFLVDIAKKMDCTYIRAHTALKSVSKLHHRIGFEHYEYVNRLKVA